jgi:hypothetical protein
MNVRMSVAIVSLLLSCAFAVSSWGKDVPLISADAEARGDGPACFPDSDYIRRVVKHRFMDQSTSLSKFMRSAGHDRVRHDDIRLLTDKGDWSICNRLNDIHSGSILSTQSQRGAANEPDAANYDVAYYQIFEFYVVLVREANPVSAIEGMTLHRTGRSTFITIYSQDLEVLWSPTMR